MTTNKFPISILDWDILGRYLLVGDISGNIQIFVQKDNLLSEWIQYYHVRLPSEHIIKAIFFHNGRKLVLQPDKKDITNYMDKFQRAKFLASCRSFGGVPADGVLVVTATGLLGAFLIPPDLPNLNKIVSGQSPPILPQILTPVTQSLGRTRSFITIADICYSKSMCKVMKVKRSINNRLVLLIFSRWKFYDRRCQWDGWKSSVNYDPLLSSIGEKANGQFNTDQSKFAELFLNWWCGQRSARYISDLFEMDLQRRLGLVVGGNENPVGLFHWAVGPHWEGNTNSYTFQAFISTAE